MNSFARSRSLFAAVAAVAAVAASGPLAAAGQLLVPSQYLDLQDAIDTALPGDVICVETRSCDREPPDRGP